MAVRLVFEGSVIPHQCYRSICVPQSILEASQDSIPARAVTVDVTSPDPEVQVASLLPLSPVHLGGSWLMKDAPRSEWTYAGIPKREKSAVRHLITVVVETSGHGNTNGNLENSSITFKKYWFLLVVCKGTLKSMLILSNG